MMLAEIGALAVEKAKATPFQIFVGLIGTLLLLSICTGCIIAWIKWGSGKRPKTVATKPMATVGLIDVIATLVILVGLVALTVTVWQLAVKPLLGLPDTLAGQNSSRSETSQTVPDSTSDRSADAAPSPAKLSEPENQTADPENQTAAPDKMTKERFLFNGFAFTAELICVLFVTAFVCARTGCSIKQLGWRIDHWREDLLAGFQVYLMVTPVILILNTLLTQLTGVPYDHPVYEMIETNPWLLGVAFWLVSVVAPIFEEFAFRAILIGWFESIHFGKNKFVSTAFGVLFNGTDSHSEQAGVAATSEPYSPPWWPVILSGVLFGLAHYSYGVSWVNLSLLGIALGRLYQIRQSLIPVIVVHCLFNSTSILFLGIKLLLPAS